MVAVPGVNLEVKEFLGRDCLHMAVEKKQVECKRVLYSLFPAKVPPEHVFVPGSGKGCSSCKFCGESLGLFNKQVHICQGCFNFSVLVDGVQYANLLFTPSVLLLQKKF